MVEILLFDSVFYNRVTPVSVSILKLPLGVIGAIPLKPQASSISRMKEVDLIFSYFFSHFYFLFDLFSFILFLELGLVLE